MSVYVDDAFVGDDVVAASWGKWTGGGHLQADALEELHTFARSIGLKRSWFQSKPGRPDHDHYDLTRSKRDAAILAGAIPESTEDGAARRRAIRATQSEQSHTEEAS
jgi:hypothetical protein